MKTFKKILLIISLTIIFIYITCLDAIPENVVLFEGEPISVSTILGMKLSDKESKSTSSNIENKQMNKSYRETGTYNLSVNIANLKLKNITINVIPKENVVLCGNTIGAKLYTNGVLVVGMSEIQGEDSQKYKPYENSGIQEGDMIVEVNSKAVTCTNDLIDKVNKCNGDKVEIKYIRDGNKLKANLFPTKTANNEYKLGLWVRDAAARSRNIIFL